MGGKPIPDAGIDFTKLNDETYKKHYVDGFRDWKNFEVYLILRNKATYILLRYLMDQWNLETMHGEQKCQQVVMDQLEKLELNRRF